MADIDLGKVLGLNPTLLQDDNILYFELYPPDGDQCTLLMRNSPF